MGGAGGRGGTNRGVPAQLVRAMKSAPMDIPGLDTDHRAIVDKANPIFYCLSTVLIFYTLLSLRYSPHIYSYRSLFVQLVCSLVMELCFWCFGCLPPV